MTAPVMPTPIPLPGDFPVTWESPAESMLLWEREQLHMPYPMSPLAAEIVCEGVGKGITQAFRTLGAPIVEARLKRVNTYVFQTVIPDLTYASTRNCRRTTTSTSIRSSSPAAACRSSR